MLLANSYDLTQKLVKNGIAIALYQAMSTQLHRFNFWNSTLATRLLAAALLALVPIAGFANTYTFADSGLKSLAHGTAYTWGLSPTANSTGSTLGSLESAIKSGQIVTSATLTITGIYDWTNEPDDVLYVNLLNDTKTGNASYEYNSNPSTFDTSFGSDVFDTLTAPTAPIAPDKPVKPTKPTAPAPLGSHPTAAQIAAYNAKHAIYEAALTVYNTAITAYNAALIVYNTDHAAYELALTAYNTALANYNHYVKTQAALGFEGVPQTPALGSLYDQSDSLLVSNTPNGPGTWTDPDHGPSGVTTLTIDFTSDNISLLDALLAGDSSTTDLGLGFGPDCHFYDTGVSLTIDTKVPGNPFGHPVPESGTTLGMLALALAALAGVGTAARRPVQA
jgi:hypothetical protein